MEKAIEISSLEFEYEKDSKVFSDLSLSIQKIFQIVNTSREYYYYLDHYLHID